MKILIFILILIFIIYNSFQISHFNTLNIMLETEKDKYRFTADTAVSILKPTLTLYYDRYDINSKYFYDDAKVVVGQKILEFEIKNEFRVSNLGPWNQIKLIYEHNYFPFLNQQMINLEEVLCQDGKMSECVSKKIVTYKTDNYNELLESSPLEMNNSINNTSTSESNTIETQNNNDNLSLIGKFGVDADFSFGDEKIVIDQDRTRQYPRNEEIVNKLPKIIFTYQKYEEDGLVDNKTTKVIEYEGIYNINNQFMRVGTNNILKFLEECFRENLEITEGGDVDSKKTNHKQIINGIDENLEEHSDFEEIKVVVPKDIKNNPNFNIDYTKIYKCKECSEFILE
jgi:hypothetical protein